MYQALVSLHVFCRERACTKIQVTVCNCGKAINVVSKILVFDSIKINIINKFQFFAISFSAGGSNLSKYFENSSLFFLQLALNFPAVCLHSNPSIMAVRNITYLSVLSRKGIYQNSRTRDELLYVTGDEITSRTFSKIKSNHHKSLIT